MNKCEVYATVPYKSKKTDELALDVNDQLVIVRKGTDTDQRWFAKLKKTGKEGYVPRNVLAVGELKLNIVILMQKENCFLFIYSCIHAFCRNHLLTN